MTFHFGARVDPETGETVDEQVLYKPKHLTTHGICFGMTGSGKSGLCIGILEEAGRSDIPVIAIDPKGDLTNLALAWPGCPNEKFTEWLDPADREAADIPAERGAKLAGIWRGGLEGAGISVDDQTEYRKRTHITVYTPGSTAGKPVSLLERFVAPPGWVKMTVEDRSDLLSGTVGAVLGLVKIDADALTSREAVLISNILMHFWDRGQSIDLPDMIRAVAQPPFESLGVFEINDFFPKRERTKLAMRLNNLVASPGFAQWLTGEPLDVGALFARTEKGSRTSIFYLAHLDDAERMSFITMLLERIVAWMREQPGSGDLRALLYFDEVFGYIPPYPKNPPSKRPLMTLLKQARAFGLGVLLATQNPVDVDYKAMTNAGTWLVGKLQTDQDKERVLDGLLAGSGGSGPRLSRSKVSDLISGLKSRQFVLACAHMDDTPVLKSRFVMSFLRGPLTRDDISRLTAADFYNDPSAPAPSGASSSSATAPTAHPVEVTPARLPAPSASPPEIIAATPTKTRSRSKRPYPKGLPVAFLHRLALSHQAVVTAFGGTLEASDLVGDIVYRPALLARASVRWVDTEGAVRVASEVTEIAWPLPADSAHLRWSGTNTPIPTLALSDGPRAGAEFSSLPEWLDTASEVAGEEAKFLGTMRKSGRLKVPACPPLGLWGEPDEPLDVFRTRVQATLDAASARVVAKRDAQLSSESEIWDRRIAELKSQLEMDKRELRQLLAEGDSAKLRRVKDGTRMALERYKDLKAARDQSLAQVRRASAATEFRAMDHLNAVAMTELDARAEVTLIGFQVLWVPDR